MEKFLHFIAHEKRYSDHTLQAYRTDLTQFTNFLESEFEMDPTLASFQTIRPWIVHLMDKEVSSRSVNRKIACLRSYYKFLLKTGVIKKDPTVKIVAPKVKKSLPVFVEEQSINHLLDEVKFDNSFPGNRDRLIIELLYGTGIRLSEMIALKESDVNFHEKTVRVIGKGKKERVIPINITLLNFIKDHIVLKKEVLQNNNSLFLVVTNKGSKCYPLFVYRTVKKYLSIITTLEKKSPHVLRHTFATHLLNKGADLNAIKELLGHANLAATQVYTHNSLEKLKTVFKQAHPKS